MRKTLIAALAGLALAAAAPASAQSLDLPRPSPNGKISQVAGLTEISVEYSSPAVKGRTIWGGLVPWGEVWRAGANATTKVTFSKDVTVGTTAVPAGSYAFFVIPNKEGAWQVVLNKDFMQGGAFGYKKELDVVRVDVKPEAIPNRERLAYILSDFTNDQANLDLEWEKVRVRLPIKLGTDAQVAANLKALEENAWQPYNAAARYELEQKKDYAAGLAWADKSLKLHEDWLNVWTKAQLLAAQGKYKEAYPYAEKAQKLGEKAPRFFFADDVKKALVDWKGKK